MNHAPYQTNFIDYIIEPKGKHPSNICTLKNQAAKVKLKRCDGMKQHIFPVLLILLDVGAAIVYATEKDWRKTVYWLAAAILNVAVTF